VTVRYQEMSQLEKFGYEEQLDRSLTTRDLVVYGMIFMLPIAPVEIFGFVWNDSRGMVPLVYLMGLIGMSFSAMSYAAMSRAFPLAGSVYTYAHRGIHEVAGFIAGWAILLDYILIPALVYVIAAIAMRVLLPGVPNFVWIVTFVILNALVNMLGIKVTARVNWYLLILQLVVLAVFLIQGLIALKSGAGAGALTLKPFYNPQEFSLGAIAGATSIAVLSFLGFDGISTLAEENRGAVGSVGRATLLALFFVGALFIIQTWIATDLAQGMNFTSPDSAFYEVSQRAGGTPLRVMVVIAMVISCGIANGMVAQAAVSRILFAMARDGKLPAFLARIHPKYKTPHLSIWLVAAISLVVGSLFAVHLDELSRIVNFGALIGFCLLHVSVVNHYFVRQRSRNWFQYLLLPLIGFSIIAYILYEMDVRAKILGTVWLTFGASYYVVITYFLKKPAKITI
jgi:amino acid transporter